MRAACELAPDTSQEGTRTIRGRRTAIIGLVVVSVVLALGLLSLIRLYQVGFEKQREYLINIAQSHARIIEAEIRSDPRSSGKINRRMSFATMKRIIEPLKSTYGSGQSEDILLSRNEGGFASFILGHRHGSLIDQTRRDAQPVRMTFHGRSGAAIGLDFRNIEVLAAYAPVKNTNLGIISKIDIAEIRAPFIENGIIGSGILLLLVVVGILNWIVEDPIVRDMEQTKHDLRQAQLQLIHTSKMATLGEMSSGIAHELNQPLSIICMAADFALMSLQEGKVDKKLIKKKLTTITSQGDRILAIISHMQAFGRKEELSLAPFAIHDSVSAAVEMIETQLRANGIEIKVTEGDARDCKIMGNPVQLEQVLLNILANAHDTIRNRLKILESKKNIFTPRIEIAMNYIKTDHTVLISISNNGGNIPEWIIGNIFDPFFTTKKKGKGTGLGLSISDSIIVGMGGNIGAENIADGARFNIIIPTI